jgi:hypothetical protein
MDTPLALTPPAPEEAASNIEGATVFNLHPDKFAEMKDQLQLTLDQTKNPPASLSPVVKSYANQSLQHLGLINGNGPSVGDRQASNEPTDPQKHSQTEGWMDYLGNQAKFIGSQVGRNLHGDDTTDMTMNKILFDSKNWNENKELDLQGSKALDAKNQADAPSFGLTQNDQYLGHVLGNFSSMASDIWNNKGVFAAATTAGAAAGFGANKVKGAVQGAALGFDAAFAYSTFKNTTASVYNNLSDSVETNGQPSNIDESTKKNVALGVGFVNAALQAGAGALITKTLPGISDAITQKAVKAMMSDPAQAGLKSAIVQLGKSAGIMGTTAGIQSVIQTFATSFTKNYNGEHGGFTNAILAATEDTKNALPQIARSSVEAAGTAAGAHVALGTVSKALSTVRAGQALEQINKLSSSTKMADVAPEEQTILLKGMADKAGVKEVFVDPANVKETWGDTGSKGASVRSWFAGKGMLNEPVPVPIHTFFDLAKDNPELIGMARISADGESVDEAKSSLAKPPEEAEKPIEPSEKLLDPEQEIAKNNTPPPIENPNLQLADQFKGVEGEKGLVSHKKQGYSQLAIEPNTLTEEQKPWLKDPQLKEHGAFVKGGIGADDAASLLGFKDPETMFKTLKDTPTREQVEAAAKPLPLEEAPTPKEITANTKAHLEEMKSLKAMKIEPAKGEEPIGIQLPIPTFGQVAADAKAQVMQMSVGDLNPDVNKVGEQNSVTNADEAKGEGRILDAFQAREAAARNSELSKQSQMAISKVNKVAQLIGKFTPDRMDQLKEKGKDYFNAANEVLTKLGLDQGTADKLKEGAVEKAQDRLTNEGKIIGPLVDPKNLPQSFKDLTVEQALNVGNTLRTIIKSADMKNAFYKAPDVGVVEGSYDAIVNEAVTRARALPGFDANRAEPPIKSNEGQFDKLARYFSDDKTLIRQEQSFHAEADKGEAAGFWYKLLFKPKDDARNTEAEYRKVSGDQTEKIIKAYGEKDFNDLANKKIFVPEFAGKKGLGDARGNITKEALIALKLNTGNEGNFKAIDRFGVDREAMNNVLERELSVKDEQLVKDFWNMYKSFYPKAQELQMRTEGTEFTPVDGDYYPLHYLRDEVANGGKKLLGSTDFNALKQNMAAQALTEQGHTIAREGSNDLLDLNLNRHGHSINQVIHDLSYREAVADTAKLLADPRVADSISGMLGKGALDLMRNNLVDVAGKVDRDGYDKSGQLVQDIVTKVANGTRFVNIALKASSALKAFSTLPQLRKTMSQSETFPGAAEYHLTSTALKMFRPDFTLSGETMKFAREIDPTIKDMGDQIAGKSANALVDLMPKKGSILDPLETGTEFAGRLGLSTVSASHQIVKAHAALSTFSQAYSGHVKGIEAGDYQAAADYAKGISATTQSHYEEDYQSVIQKLPLVKDALAYYFTDANNANNNNTLQYKLMKQKFAESGSAYDKNELGIAMKAAAQGIGGMMNHVATVVIPRALILSLTGTGTAALGYYMFGGKEPDTSDDVATTLLKKSIAEMGGTYPLAREGIAALAYQSGRTGYEFKNPILEGMGNMFTASVAGLTHALPFFENYENDMTDEEKKALVTTIGGYGLHLPTDAIMKMLGSPDLSDANNLPNAAVGLVQKLIGSITNFTAKNDTKILSEQADEEFMKGLAAVKENLAPAGSAVTPQVASNSQAYFKKLISAEGDNDYTAENKSGAYGAYQIKPGTWKGIRENNPDLNLPKNIRDATPAQQDSAIKELTKENAERLAKEGIKVNDVSLYFMHMMPPRDALDALREKDESKPLSSQIPLNEIKSNWQALGAKSNSKPDLNAVTIGDAKVAMQAWLDDHNAVLTKLKNK